MFIFWLSFFYHLPPFSLWLFPIVSCPMLPSLLTARHKPSLQCHELRTLRPLPVTYLNVKKWWPSERFTANLYRIATSILNPYLEAKRDSCFEHLQSQLVSQRSNESDRCAAVRKRIHQFNIFLLNIWREVSFLKSRHSLLALYPFPRPVSPLSL